jgi:hypothetical protein
VFKQKHIPVLPHRLGDETLNVRDANEEQALGLQHLSDQIHILFDSRKVLEHVKGDNEIERCGWKNVRAGNACPIAGNDFIASRHPAALGADFEASPSRGTEFAEEPAVATAKIEERDISAREFANGFS